MFSLKLEGLNSGLESLPGLHSSKGDLINVLNMERRGNQALLGEVQDAESIEQNPGDEN